MTEKEKKAVLSEYFAKLGKKGGPKGGRSRIANLTPEERSALARKAAEARWGGRQSAVKKAQGGKKREAPKPPSDRGAKK